MQDFKLLVAVSQKRLVLVTAELLVSYDVSHIQEIWANAHETRKSL